MTDAPLPQVAIITRTRNRSMFLRRAIASVLEQTHRNWHHVIVNDGGDPEKVDQVVHQCHDPHRKVTVLHRSESTGMEAASNAGIAASDSPYLVIHDDDDSWDPRFLSETLNHLQTHQADGVVTHAVQVEEELKEDHIHELSRRLYNGQLQFIDFGDLAICNRFPPISFVYRRCVLEAIGPYREDLPVLGDWEFNLRFLLRSNIHVLPKPLCYYHHRVTQSSGSAANSIIADTQRHAYYTSYVRHLFLRDYPHVGGTIALAGQLGELQGRVGILANRVEHLRSQRQEATLAQLRRLTQKDAWSEEHKSQLLRAVRTLEHLTQASASPQQLSDARFDNFKHALVDAVAAGDINTDQTIYIVGASAYGAALALTLLDHGITPAFFFDNDPLKDHQALEGIPIRKPNRTLRPQPLLIVSSVGSARYLHEQMAALCGPDVPIMSCHGLGL